MPVEEPRYVPFSERPPDTRAVKAAFKHEVTHLMDELQRAADRARSQVATPANANRAANARLSGTLPGR